jgi:histidinol-phosphatase
VASDLDDDLALARRLGRLADEVSLPYFRTEIHHELKGDGSPVTAADLAVERVLLDALAAERPDDTVLSEETGLVEGRSGRRWLLDPIDGTSYFLAGAPDWGTHVALEVDGAIVLGLITRPVEGRGWWATRGGGAWSSDGGRLQVTTTASLADARVAGYVRSTSAWRGEVSRTATWVDSPSPILELLEGRVDAFLSESGCEWDHAPGVILTAEAGGRFTDLEGGTRIDLRGGLYSNGRLDDALWAAR